MYGHGWREPKPGFRWRYDRTKADRAARLPDDWCEEVYWANFYSRNEYPSPSTFFEAVSTRADLPDIVVDIGCGDGRDSFAFAEAGRRVTGVDRSHVAVRHASERAAKLGLDRVEFVTCDVSDAAAVRAVLTGAREASGGSPMLYYLRFFLHSIPLEVQNTLLGVIEECARSGDVFVAEFRTDKDAAKRKVHHKHYRRFQNGPEFGAQLQERYGFDLLEESEGTGLAPYKDEDPELYRVIARRP